jgi:hypothetical protein
MDIKSVFKDAEIDTAKLTAVLKLAADEADKDDEDKAEDEDETEEEKSAREAKEKKAADEEAEAKKDEDDGKKANDAAIAAARQGGRDDALREFAAIRQAEEAVRPLIGAVAAMDSAEAVYRFALDSAGVDTKDIHASALPAMVKLATERKTAPPRVAMDAAASDDFAKRFPNATKIARA